MKKKNKKESVLALLKRGQSITQRSAINLFAAYRLSDIIFRLKNEGHNIVTKLEPNKDGSGFHARYRLVK